MPRQYSYLWPYSGTFSAVNALFAATQDTTYKIILDHQVLVGLEEYFDDERKPAGYASYVRNLRQSDRFYDDNIWVRHQLCFCLFANPREQVFAEGIVDMGFYKKWY